MVSTDESPHNSAVVLDSHKDEDLRPSSVSESVSLRGDHR